MKKALILTHRPVWSISLLFLTLNILMGSWLSRLPEIQERLMLSEGQLGLALLGMPLGAFAGTSLSSRFLTYWRTGQLAYRGALLFMLVALMVPLAFNQYSLMIILAFAGFLDGIVNVSMNTAANTLEEHLGTRIMSSCHGMFSLGGFIGAVASGLAVSAGISLFTQLLVLSLFVFLLLFKNRYYITHTPESTYSSQEHTPHSPKKIMILLAIIGFCVMVGEGAIADWSAIFMRNEVHSSSGVAALAYGSFSLFMALGRFSGDAIRNRISALLILRHGALLGLLGICLAIFAKQEVLSIIGFSLTGIGFSILVPILFSEAAKRNPKHPDRGIALIANAGIIGFLMAPPAIGFLGEHMGLSMALGIVALLALLATTIAFRIR